MLQISDAARTSSSFWMLRPFQTFLQAVEDKANIAVVSGRAIDALRHYLPLLMLPLFILAQELWQIRNRILHPPKDNRFQPKPKKPISRNVQQILRFPLRKNAATAPSAHESTFIDTDFPDWTPPTSQESTDTPITNCNDSDLPFSATVPSPPKEPNLPSMPTLPHPHPANITMPNKLLRKHILPATLTSEPKRQKIDKPVQTEPDAHIHAHSDIYAAAHIHVDNPDILPHGPPVHPPVGKLKRNLHPPDSTLDHAPKRLRTITPASSIASYPIYQEEYALSPAAFFAKYPLQPSLPPPIATTPHPGSATAPITEAPVLRPIPSATVI